MNEGLVFIGVTVPSSISMETKYLRVLDFLIVQVRMIPLNLLWKRVLMPSLNLGRVISSSLKETLKACGIAKDCLVCFDLNLGKLFFVLKNRWYALSK